MCREQEQSSLLEQSIGRSCNQCEMPILLRREVHDLQSLAGDACLLILVGLLC